MLFQGIGQQVEIESKVFEVVKRYLQVSLCLPESGGAIFGRESPDGSLLVINHITEPMDGDKQSRRHFDRLDTGHGKRFTQLNTEANIYAYVGDWHTHPQAIPKPSTQDRRNWTDLLEMDVTRKVQYHLIAGTREARVWSSGPSIGDIRMLLILRWEELSSND
ncbi:Mov34/MPN/PAD-1 family protein [Coriobacteriaceae bacterium BV3Ac1]|uniref:Mov34/MPN/PAD-1 family protein n=1 Tax=Olegusella massiliensis TaxID=1776381 RepID=UPI000557731E|nr:Mov34/MPN/PAD-1 family protein [Coriobacteriaceae bacterium]